MDIDVYTDMSVLFLSIFSQMDKELDLTIFVFGMTLVKNLTSLRTIELTKLALV